MSDILFVVDDTQPSVSGDLTNVDGSPLDLTGCTVRFQVRLAMDRRLSVDAAAEILSAAAGTVRYDWSNGDITWPGDYVSRWQVTYPDDTVQHTTPENTISVGAI